ncbi:MAG: polysaccharide deacetylase family protein [Alphaproteobacteria bacterium]|nr:polysaccharide deacetylase family protein [Alphaproteobacteria bacterium]
MTASKEILARTRRAVRRRAAAISVVLLAALAALVPATPGRAQEPSSAVILMYHRFGDESVASANIRIEQFEAHLNELAAGGYTVLPLADIVASLKSDTPLPDQSVAITIDTAHVSVFEEAWPRLRAAGYPFTVFVASDLVDAGRRDVMTWSQLGTLQKDGATIAALGASYTNLAMRPPEKVAADILRSKRRISDEIGATPPFFAYPFGVYDGVIKGLVRDAGFEAAFGQHSGAAHALDDMFSLPRFSLTEAYGSLERFRLVARTLPLPVTDITPALPVLTERNPPNIGFTLSERIAPVKSITCFASGQGKVSVERLPAGRVEVRLPGPFAHGRARLNCTSVEGDRWRWFGRQFYVPRS